MKIIIAHLARGIGALQRRAHDVATRPVVAIAATASLETALGKLNEHKVGALAITDNGGALLGLVTERDVLLKTGLGHMTFRSVLEQPIAAFMTPLDDTTRATPDSTLDQCLQKMLATDGRHMPVLDASGRLESMLSLRDVCCAVIAGGELESTTSVGEALYFSDQRVGSITEVSATSVVADAVIQMRSRGTSSVLVPLAQRTIAEGCVSYGIFTERDYAQRALTSGVADVRYAPLHDFITMPPALISVERGLPVVEALAILAREKIRHVPVVAEATEATRPHLLGVLSMRELIAHLFT